MAEDNCSVCTGVFVWVYVETHVKLPASESFVYTTLVGYSISKKSTIWGVLKNIIVKLKLIFISYIYKHII